MAATTFTTQKGISALSFGTAALWAASTVIIPAGVPCFESDTGKMKVGNGTALYSALPYVIDQVLTSAMKSLLDKAGQADGVVVLDANGLIPADKIPLALQARPVFVANIAARDAVPVAERNAVFIVIDASADTSVEGGMASYAWDDTNEVWMKISEQESMDLDFTSFVKAGDSADRLIEGTNNKFLTQAERDKIAVAMTTDKNYIFTSGPADFTA